MKISSTGLRKIFAILHASGRLGGYFPVTMALTVCRDTRVSGRVRPASSSAAPANRARCFSLIPPLGDAQPQPPRQDQQRRPPVHVEAGQSAFCWKAQVRVIRQMARKLNATASSWIRRCSSSSPRNIRINAQRAKAKTDGMRKGKRYRIPAACVRGLATSTWKPEPSPRRRPSNHRIPSGSVSHWRPWNSPSQACFTLKM